MGEAQTGRPEWQRKTVGQILSSIHLCNSISFKEATPSLHTEPTSQLLYHLTPNNLPAIILGFSLLKHFYVTQHFPAKNL